VLGFANDSGRWDRVAELSGVVAGKVPARTGNDQVTLFKSNGIAAWDLAAAMRVYSEATRRNLGRLLPLWQPAS